MPMRNPDLRRPGSSCAAAAVLPGGCDRPHRPPEARRPRFPVQHAWQTVALMDYLTSPNPTQLFANARMCRVNRLSAFPRNDGASEIIGGKVCFFERGVL